jgi:hypothetical protein
VRFENKKYTTEKRSSLLQRWRNTLGHFFEVGRRKYFSFQNALGDSWHCKFLQHWRCKSQEQSYVRLFNLQLQRQRWSRLERFSK